MTRRLADRTCVVTGAGSGIGRACAVAFANEGATVVGLDINAEGLNQTADLVATNLTVVEVDISDSRAVDGAFAAIAEDHGEIHVLANIAGIVDGGSSERDRVKSAYEARRSSDGAEPFDLLTRVTDDEFDLVFRVNVYGSFYCLRAAVPHIRSGGSVINMCSLAAFRTPPRSIAYSASKAAIAGLTRSAAYELSDRGIRVNAVAPGLVQTAMPDVAPFVASGTLAATPMGRFGTPEEIAGVFTFLASDDSSFMTGQTVGVNGGAYM